MREVLEIADMNCNNCFETIKRFVLDCDGVVNIDLHLPNKTIIIDFNPPATIEKIQEAIEDSGFSIKQMLKPID